MNVQLLSQSVAEIRLQIEADEAALAEKKRAVNALCAMIGQSPAYDCPQPATHRSTVLRSDQFYGRPLATVVREILDARKASGLGAASTDEIYAVLTQGGYKFDATAKRALAVSLAKNPAFHKLPNDDFGLAAWYPNARAKAEKNKTDDKTATKQDADKPSEEAAPAESPFSFENGDDLNGHGGRNGINERLVGAR